MPRIRILHAIVRAFVLSLPWWFMPPATAVATESAGWDSVPAILNRISPPKILDRYYKITDYGAVGDGQTNCRPAFDKAIADANSAGGGRVVVPAGDWFIRGPIHLKSNVNLHTEEGA